MKVKDIFNAMVYGAAATAGAMMVKKAVVDLKDPYKKAKLKRKFADIKDVITRKENES